MTAPVPGSVLGAPIEEVPQIPVKMSRRQWTVVLLLVVSVIINYVDRSNLSIAAPVIQHEFALSPLQIGSLLSAFFWSYALLQIFGIAGWLTDRFPVGWVMMGGYVVWSTATAATALTSSFATLFLVRLLLGLGESIAYPCYSKVFAELPQQNRGRANALIDAGTKLGPAIGALVGGILLVHFGWRMLFIILGTGGLLWVFPWFKAMPRNHRRTEVRGAQLLSITKLFHMKAAWGTFLGHFCGNYFFYFLLAWLPTYLVREEKMQIGLMSRLTSALFLLIASTTLTAGWISDYLIAAGNTPTRVRRSVAVGGLTVASGLIGIAFVHGSLITSLAVLTVSCVGYGAYSSQHWAITQTLAGPTMAGRWTSLQNGFSNLSGIIAPWVAGLAVQLTGNSRLAFVVTGAVALVGAFSWALLVRHVEPVQWETVG